MIGKGSNSGTIKCADLKNAAKTTNDANGTWTVLGGTFTNTGAFDNAGTFTCASIINEGAFTNATTGTVQLNTSLSNEATGTFTNEGAFTTASGAGITNSGSFYLNAGSNFDIDARFTNDGSVIMTGDSSSPSIFYTHNISNSDGVINQAGGTIEIGAFCVFENTGSSAPGVTNEGKIIIKDGGTLTTNNYFTNTGAITNDGTYYGLALTGGAIDGVNKDQVTGGNSKA